MFEARVDEDVALKPLETHDASALFSLIEENRSYLREWLPWLDSNRHEHDSRAFIEWCARRMHAGKDIVTGVWHGRLLVGVIGLHGIDSPSKAASIGYWIAEGFQGRGIVTRAVRVMVDHAFRALKLHRVEIRCAPGNTASRGIPTRLGFTQEGTLRHAELLYDRYVDSVVYGILETEWPE